MNSSDVVFRIPELLKIIKDYLENRCRNCGTKDKNIINKNEKYCIWCLN